MNWFYNLKIGTKLLSGFVLVAVIAGVIGWIGISNMRGIAAKDTMMYEQSLVPIAQLGKISTDFQRVRVNLAKVLLSKDAENKVKYASIIKELGDEITKVSDQIALEMTSAEEKALFTEFTNSRTVFRPIIARLIDLSSAGKDAEALVLYEGDAVTAARAEQAAIDKLVEMHTTEAKLVLDQNKASAQSAVRFTVFFVLLGMLLAIGLGIFIARIITNPLKRGVEFAQAIASGDLTRRLDMTCKDEIGSLARALDDMVANLREVISKITTTSDSVSSAAIQLSASSTQMATGTEEVAAQVGSVATAGEEMAATSMEIAQNCSMAAESSKLAKESAFTGAAIVQETISLMNQIAERVKDSAQTVESLGSRSDQIGEIIGTIEDIADQTNLLALNAAI